MFKRVFLRSEVNARFWNGQKGDQMVPRCVQTISQISTWGKTSFVFLRGRPQRWPKCLTWGRMQDPTHCDGANDSAKKRCLLTADYECMSGATLHVTLNKHVTERRGVRGSQGQSVTIIKYELFGTQKRPKSANMAE